AACLPGRWAAAPRHAAARAAGPPTPAPARLQPGEPAGPLAGHAAGPAGARGLAAAPAGHRGPAGAGRPRPPAQPAPGLPSRAALRGRHIALVDDVLTTGATCAALARLLLDAGAARVDVYCLARTPKPDAANTGRATAARPANAYTPTPFRPTAI